MADVKGRRHAPEGMGPVTAVTAEGPVEGAERERAGQETMTAEEFADRPFEETFRRVRSSVSAGSRDETPFGVDHVFVSVSMGAPEIAALVRAGFEEGPPNVHPGQGTACRRVFFENAYLELAWLEDPAEASAPSVERTGLASRMGCLDGVSRLGVALRPTAGADLPVSTWPYAPPYLPAGMSIPVAANSRMLHEPLLFFMPRDRRWDAPIGPHPNGARRVTDISIALPEVGVPSRELEWLRTSGCVRVEPGPAELLTIELDHGARGGSTTLTPAAPLGLRW